MRTINHILAVAWKELQVLAQDRGSLIILFLLPLLFGSFYGSAMTKAAGSGEDGILVKVCLVNEDAGPLGQNVVAVVEAIPALAVTRYDSVAEAENVVTKGQATAAIVIPAGFSDLINAYTPTSVQVLVDPGQPLAASIVTGIMNQVVDEVSIWGEVSYGIRSMLSESGQLAQAGPETLRAIQAQSQGTIMATLDEMRRAPVIAVTSETDDEVAVRAGAENFFAYLFPGLAVMFIFFGVTTSARSLLSERETGTLRRLLAAPMPRGAVIAGTMLAYVVLGSLQVTIMLLVGRLVFKIPLGNSPAGLVVHTLAVSLAAASMGVMIAALARTSRQANSIALLLGFVLGAVGSCIPMGMTMALLTRSGGAMQTVALLTPQGHGVEGFYRLMVERGSFLYALPESGILLGMALLFFLVGTWRFRYE
jgi:ABC-2 type transport system permease protein